MYMAAMQADSKRTSAFFMNSRREFVCTHKQVGVGNYCSWKAKTAINYNDNSNLEAQYENVHAIPIPKQKKKNKCKKRVGQFAVNGKQKSVLPFVTLGTTKHAATPTAQPMPAYSPASRKINRSRKHQRWSNNMKNRFFKSWVSSTALRSIYSFFALLAVNILVIYMIMFKNPELAEKTVDAIPQQYRDWIITKTEIFRVNIGDWIADFLTPPDEQ